MALSAPPLIVVLVIAAILSLPDVAGARCRRATLIAAAPADPLARFQRIPEREPELGAEPGPDGAGAGDNARGGIATDGVRLEPVSSQAEPPHPETPPPSKATPVPAQPPGQEAPVAKPLPTNAEPAAGPSPTRIPPEPSWAIEPGKSLRQTLAEWTERAGWHLVWGDSLVKVDYLIEASHVWHGDFLTAAKELMRNYRSVEVPLKVEPIMGNRQFRVLAASDPFTEQESDP